MYTYPIKLKRTISMIAGIISLLLFYTPAYAADNSTVFKGYFKNADYTNPDNFLKLGPQTMANDEISQIAKGFNDKKDISTLQEIYKWMKANLHYGEGEKFSRTVADIFKTRTVTGCTDDALAFSTLCREKGIPAVFVQTARLDWVEKLVKNSPDAQFIIGHNLVEVYINDQWYLVDSTSGKLFLNYDKTNFSLCDGYYVYAKSIEVWDSGVRNNSENSKAITSLFKNFDLSTYKNPLYDYINLSTGQKQKSFEFVDESTVIGDLAVILGTKETGELFDSRFTSQFKKKKMAAFMNIDKLSATGTARLILLYSPDRIGQIPEFITSMVPEIKTGKPSMILNEVRLGRRIILIKALTEKELIDKINSLNYDFLDNDYIEAPALIKIGPSKNSLELQKGQLQEIKLTGTYSDKSEKDLTGDARWTSDNSLVAKVESGKITAAGQGTTKIWAEVEGIKTSLEVRIKNDIISLVSSQKSITLKRLKSANIVIYAKQYDGSLINITNSVRWTVSKTSVAGITNGRITGKNAGSTLITGTYNNLKVEITVKVIK